MKKELIDEVTTGFTKMIEAELATDSATRFQRVAQLAKQAHNVVQMNALRVAEVDQDEILGIEEAGLGFDRPIRIGGRLNRPLGGDPGDMMRELVHAMQPMLAFQNEKHEEKRLSRLLLIRERLEKSGRSTDAVDARIDAAITELDDKEKDDGLDVADTFILRGRETRNDRQDDDAADRREGDGGGEESPREAAEGGA